MGSDLVSACVFCAGILLGMELPPPPGYNTEIGFSYATAARRYVIGQGSDDTSDVTPKFVLVGLGWSRAASAGLGAGTPEAEWRVRVALAPSHDEQEQTPFAVTNTTATGTGRYENFAILARYPVSDRDSLEAAWDRRTHKATDELDVGHERFFLSEQRVLSAERADVGIGWRHRWTGIEAALSARFARPSGSQTTSATDRISEGTIYGGALEARARRGRWTLAASAERASGSIGVHEQSQPAFVHQDFNGTATLEAYRIGVGYAASKTEAFFQATYDRSRLPFVAFAVLGTEVAALEAGYHPESRANLVFWDLTVRQTFVPGFRVKVLLRSSSGDETLTLTDPVGVLPGRQLDVRRSGVFGAGLSRILGGPEVSLGVGAEIALPFK
jgi:hypothetical protein